MSNKADQFLAKTLGEDFYESLSKTELWKPGTRTVIDPQEIRIALKIVPRVVLSLLQHELIPMQLGETKELDLHFAPNALVRVTKHERDVYSGEIEQDNKRIVDFKHRSLPGVGLVIMSTFELYDMNELKGDHKDLRGDADQKVQKMIDERLAMHRLVEEVVEGKLRQRDAVNTLLLAKLTEALESQKKTAEDIANMTEIMAKDPASKKEEYLRGMANGLAVANSAHTGEEPKFIDPPKSPGDEGCTEDFSLRVNEKLNKSAKPKGSPLKAFLENRKKPKEFVVHMAKGEQVDCPDCGKNIFDGKLYAGCICLGDDMDRKVFLKKTEDGIKIRFARGWDPENIEMVLEVLRKKNG